MPCDFQSASPVGDTLGLPICPQAVVSYSIREHHLHVARNACVLLPSPRGWDRQLSVLIGVWFRRQASPGLESSTHWSHSTIACSRVLPHHQRALLCGELLLGYPYNSICVRVRCKVAQSLTLNFDGYITHYGK